MLRLDGSRMETVIMPYQPSLVPYRINEQLPLLAPLLQLHLCVPPMHIPAHSSSAK